VPILARGADLAAVYRSLAARARAAGVPFLPAVAPGFDDRVIRVPGTVIPRAGGATYDATWRSALAAEPAAVLVASWNEWHEGSEIEASLEHGTRYLEATRAWAERFRARAR
jgi:glycoprotein endo-alpha-1,2-mannosidase